MLVLSCVQLHGTLRVVMEPLLGDMPLVGALSVFFLKKPVSTLTFHPSASSCPRKQQQRFSEALTQMKLVDTGVVTVNWFPDLS